MLLNLSAVYGLRAMATLATLEPGQSVNAETLSQRTNVPQQYLSKIMRKLVVARLVQSQRGHGGGFRLMVAPNRIRVADVLRAIDIELDGGCAFGYERCDESNPCILHPIWTRLQTTLDEWSQGSTLADLGPPPVRSRRRG